MNKKNKEIGKVILIYLLIITFCIGITYYVSNLMDSPPKEIYIEEIIMILSLAIFFLIIMFKSIKKINDAYKIMDETLPRDAIFDDFLIYARRTESGYETYYYPIIKEVSGGKMYLIPDNHNFSRFTIIKTQSIIGNKYDFKIKDYNCTYKIKDANSVQINIGDNVMFYSKNSYEKCVINDNNISINDITAPYYNKNSEIEGYPRELFINIHYDDVLDILKDADICDAVIESREGS